MSTGKLLAIVWQLRGDRAYQDKHTPPVRENRAMERADLPKMSESSPEQDISLLREWRQKLEVANHNNVFCHCRRCGAQWVDSSFDATCSSCGSLSVEHISCWQFPDD